jgi:hypothetical protein
VSCILNGHELRILDRIGDVGSDCLHVRNVFLTDDHHRRTADLAEEATDGRLENFLLSRA